MKIQLSYIALTVLSISLGTSAHAASPIDAQREKIILFSREGDVQLEQAIPQLNKLYQQTKDPKVRDDLIALLMKKSRFQEATEVCPTCDIRSFSANELENLGRAYRNQKQPAKSLEIYTALRTKMPNNTAGWLGSALVEIELRQYAQARAHLKTYKAKFGADSGYQEAMNYLEDLTEADMAKLGRYQKMLAQDPHNDKLVLQLYRLAARYSVLPLQESIINNYPGLFTQQDRQWYEHNTVIGNTKGKTVTRQQLQQNYHKLSEIINQSEPNSLLHQQALQDHLVLASRLNYYADVRRDYAELSRASSVPNYVKEAYADAMLASGSPYTALTVYRELADQQKANSANKSISSSLLYKLANAASDAGYYEDAEQYIDQISDTPFILDYTQTARRVNPDLDQKLYSKANILSWRGEKGAALDLLNDRLTNVTPGDPWVLLAMSDVERSRNNFDDATALAATAKEYMLQSNMQSYQSAMARIALDKRDIHSASQIINRFNAEQKESNKGLLNDYEQVRAARFIASYGVSHRTSLNSDQKPAFGNEVNQEYYLYSPKTEDGHDIYLHYSSNNSPDAKFERNFRLQRLGIGTELNFYPLTATVEAGKNLKLSQKRLNIQSDDNEQDSNNSSNYQKLKNKPYITLNLNYVLNQNWRFNLNTARNGADTPVKAVYQNVYTKDIGLGATYTYQDLFSIDVDANWMKFDDSNLRKTASIVGNLNSYTHDRWDIANTLRFDYVRNRDIKDAWYYNPLNSRSMEFGADISYTQPLDHGLAFTHHVRGTFGHYWQSTIKKRM
ncbi:poly-beta-1,6 N-acetyl-D-glucosamine export porin PgaA [Pasteurellaceae bacterium LIM206]|nr:poly-beta-1,6 N-acetyl-D-glucosamine export porin PgaA [Pasteurellaceae bacterium LIM206]